MDAPVRRPAPRSSGVNPYALVVSVVALLLMFQVLGWALTGLSAQRDARQSAEAVFTALSEVDAERVVNHVRPVWGTVRDLSAEVVADGFASRSEEERLDVLRSALRAHPQLGGVSVALADGSFMALERQGGGYELRTAPGPLERVSVTVLDGDLQPREIPRSSRAPVDVRARDWYTAAVFSSAPVWLPAEWPQGGEGPPDFHLTAPVRDDGDLVGVVRVTLDGGSLVPLVGSLALGTGDRVLLLDSAGAIIGAPLTDDAATQATELSSVEASESDLPTSSEARIEHQDGGMVLERQVALGGGMRWVLRMEATVEMVVPGVTNYQRTMLWYTVGIAVVVLAAVLVLARMRNPLRDLHARASTDALTGVANRHEFGVAGAGALDAAHARGERVVTVVLDVDNFKRVNDNHGHDAGDRALVAMAEALDGLCGPRDVLARLGGDEFAVVRRLARDEDPFAVAERMRAVASEALAGLVSASDADVSAGFAVSAGHHDTLEQLTQAADRALVAGRRRRKGATYGGGTRRAARPR